jgi:hypothetical protein
LVQAEICCQGAMKSSWKALMKSLPSISLMSAPAANARSEPVRTITATAGSRSNVAIAWVSSATSWALSAFSALGRFNVIRPIGPRLSTKIVSYAIQVLLSEVRRHTGQAPWRSVDGALRRAIMRFGRGSVREART